MKINTTKILKGSTQVGKKIAVGAMEYVAIQVIADAVVTKINEYKDKKAEEKKAEYGFTS